MSNSKLSDPKVVGPGAWFSIHRKAFTAKSTEEKKNFMEFMNDICNNFPCLDCRGHCRPYIKEHPMEHFMNVKSINGEDIGMFKWSWIFHNAVNSRLGKPIVDWDTAYNMFNGSDAMVCSKGCGEESPPSSQATPTVDLLSQRMPNIIQPLYSAPIKIIRR